MKSSLIAALALLSLGLSVQAAETTAETAPDKTEQKAPDKNPGMPLGMKSEQETLEAEVLKVYQAESKEAKFRAYVVKWNDQEIVVSDPLGVTDNKVGDKITFMAVRMSMPIQEKTINVLQFMVMDFPALMK